MKVPLSLLLQYCDPGLEPEEIASVLALTGTEVERVRRLGPPDPSGFVVGRVIAAEQHPDADRLRVCSVDVGGDSPAQIVCGAPNVAAGQTVAVALPGAVMPGGMKIKKAKLRGVESNGMICAEDELELGSGHEGILVLDDGIADPGTALSDVLPLGEVVLDLEITPNRPDCLGVYGVARELHAATGAALADPPWQSDPGSWGALDGAEVEVETPVLCPRFTARIYEGIGAAETPIAIRAHLHSAGMRSISPVVDITNYVMLVVGEPLHAFDLDRISGARLIVREATEGETIETLDGQERAMVADEVVICDSDGPTSIAGVMGGARSEVSDSTTRILLEAAVWDGPSIHDTSARLALRSEASGRFEKGLAPVQVGRAQAFAAVLFQQMFGVDPLPGTLDVDSSGPGPAPIQLEEGVVERTLGHSVGRSRVTEILGGLGFSVEPSESGITVTPPADRLDVGRPVDVVEEVARIDGLDSIPATLPPAGTGGGLTRHQRIRRSLADSMVGQGFHEIAGWSFASPKLGDRLRLPADDPRREAVVIENPMSEDESILRTTLLGSLLDSAARNSSRGAGSVRLFEMGPVYRPDADGLASQPLRLGGVILGPARRSGWRDQAPPDSDVFTGIGVISGAVQRLKVESATTRPRVPEPFLHPGRSATVTVGGVEAGWVGELHPLVAGQWDLGPAVVFELDVAAVVAAVPAVVHYEPVSAHPAVVQDLAVTVSSDVGAEQLISIARDTGGSELEDVAVFDVYSGEQLEAGKVSVGLRLRFRAADRTLTEEEATNSREAITAALIERVEGEIRG